MCCRRPARSTGASSNRHRPRRSRPPTRWHLCRKQGLHGLGASPAQAADEPRLAEALASPRHALALKAASGEPAGPRLSLVAFGAGAGRGGREQHDGGLFLRDAPAGQSEEGGCHAIRLARRHAGRWPRLRRWPQSRHRRGADLSALTLTLTLALALALAPAPALSLSLSLTLTRARSLTVTPTRHRRRCCCPRLRRLRRPGARARACTSASVHTYTYQAVQGRRRRLGSPRP